jgi:aarF domain-containing kinase
MKPQNLKLIPTAFKQSARFLKTCQVLGYQGIKWAKGNHDPAEQLRETFESLGCTYIKLGQFIASAPSLFPKNYVLAFQNCLDKAPTLPFHEIKAILTQELNQPLESLFLEIDPIPIASASIAQVHAAKWITGEPVVIKVQKPGVKETILTDFRFLKTGAYSLEKLMPKLSLTNLSLILADIQDAMTKECDFIQEAKNIEDFQAFLTETNNTFVKAPNVYHQATTTRVLTMERFFGQAFNTLSNYQGPHNPQQALMQGLQTWMSLMTSGKPFHADVHAGNLMLLNSGQIGFIDFGIVSQIKIQTWQAIQSFMTAMTLRDFDQMAKALIGIGLTQTDIDPAPLARDLESLLDTENQSLSQFNPDYQSQAFLTNLADLCKAHGIGFPREFALLVKQLMYFDHYIQLLGNTANVPMSEWLSQAAS